jgi:hypothetical protein
MGRVAESVPRERVGSPPGPTAGVPANSDKSRSATSRIASLGCTVGCLSWMSLAIICGELRSSSG